MKKTLLTLALLAAPILAMAAPEVAVHQTAVPRRPTITIPSRSILRAHIISNRFRVEQLLPIQVTLASVSGPPIRVTLPIRIHTALALRSGEIVRLKIVPRGRP